MGKGEALGRSYRTHNGDMSFEVLCRGLIPQGDASQCPRHGRYHKGTMSHKETMCGLEAHSARGLHALKPIVARMFL